MYSVNKNYHFFKYKDKFFVYGIRTKILAEVSPLTYSLVQQMPNDRAILTRKYLNQYSRREINETFTELIKNEIISRKKANKEMSPPNRNFFKKDEIINNLKFNGLYLVISQDCNLRCKYCSADFGRFGKDVKIKLMSKKVAEEALNYFFDNIQDDLEQLTIVFIGGEPLLNFDVLRESVEFCRNRYKRPINFVMNTNGILMNDEKAKWFANNKDISVRFSVDGTQEMHDASRIYLNGKGSYDDTIKGLKTFLKYNPNQITIQASINKGKQLKDAIYHLWGLGAFRVIANFTGPSAFLDCSDYDMNEKDFEKYMEELDKINEEICNNLINQGHSRWITPTEGIIRNIHMRSLKTYYGLCGAGHSISITPDGSIYVCQGFVGFEQYKIGTIYTGINYDKLEEFGEKWVQYLNKCSECWVRYSCSVACVAQGIIIDGLESKKTTKICDFSKRVFEASAYLYSKLMDEKPELFNTYNKEKRL